MDISAVDLNLLTVLDALIKERHVTRAGRRVGLSQSATSAALARLRALLGDPLFLRTRDGMIPTQRTVALSHRLEATLDNVRSLLSSPDFDPKTVDLTWNVRAGDYVQWLVLPAVVRFLSAHAPHVALRAQPILDSVQEHLSSGDADVVVAPFLRASPGIRVASLFRETMTCIVRREHPLAKKKRISLRTYAAMGHVLVSPEGRGTAMIDYVLAGHGLQRRVLAIVPNFLVAPELVAHSDLVATLPTRVAKKAAVDGRFFVFEPPLAVPGFEMVLGWHARSDDAPAHRWLRNALLRCAGAETRSASV